MLKQILLDNKTYHEYKYINYNLSSFYIIKYFDCILYSFQPFKLYYKQLNFKLVCINFNRHWDFVFYSSQTEPNLNRFGDRLVRTISHVYGNPSVSCRTKMLKIERLKGGKIMSAIPLRWLGGGVCNNTVQITIGKLLIKAYTSSQLVCIASETNWMLLQKRRPCN